MADSMDMTSLLIFLAIGANSTVGVVVVLLDLVAAVLVYRRAPTHADWSTNARFWRGSARTCNSGICSRAWPRRSGRQTPA